jgi:hypothetical protein
MARRISSKLRSSAVLSEKTFGELAATGFRRLGRPRRQGLRGDLAATSAGVIGDLPSVGFARLGGRSMKARELTDVRLKVGAKDDDLATGQMGFQAARHGGRRELVRRDVALGRGLCKAEGNSIGHEATMPTESL